jgi:putative DNA primase/helicase
MTDDTPHYCDEALKAAGIKPEDRDENLIAELAKLKPLTYGRRREEEAASLGVKLAILDKIVAEKRREIEKGTTLLYPHWKVEPAEESIDTALLLQALVQRIRRYVIISPEGALAIALWVMLTWIHEAAAVHSPILLITSAEPDSGKSTAMGVIGFVVRRSLLTVDITGPVLFRSIEKWLPTFAIDEADRAFVDNDDLRSVINSGWTRGQGVPRCDPETNEPRVYPTFCPKAIGMKGRSLPDTTLSRTIIVEMKRKLPSEAVEDFDHLDDAESADLRRQLARWAEDNTERLKGAQPQIPPGFHNRVRANWKLLLAIAELGGDDWKRQAWQAAGAIEGIRATFETSIGVTLLRAIRDMFREGVDCLLSKEIIAELTADPEQPWVEYKHGKAITQKQLAALLRGYRIFPSTVHPPEPAPHGRGYNRLDFEDAWGRLLSVSPGNPVSEVCKCANADEAGTTSNFRSVQEDAPHTSKNGTLPYGHAGLHTCTDQNPGIPATHPLCAQCRGEEGAPPALHSGPGYPPEGVWLHRECARFWSPKAPAAPHAKVESTSASAGPSRTHGDPWADLDIPAYLNRQ